MTDENAPSQPTTPSPRGLPYALGAYTLWGFLPLYLVLLLVTLLVILLDTPQQPLR